MVSGFDIWGHDPNLRSHWKARFIAFLADALLTFLPVSIILYVLGITDILQFGIVSSVAFYLVTNIPESLTGQSPGKRMMGLKVFAAAGGSIAGRVCVRNLNRLFWFVLPPLDFTLGMAVRGDPRQRMLDRVAGTKVVHRDEAEKHEEHLERLARAGEDEEQEIPKQDRCRECNGKLILLPDDKLQCEECGLIQ